MNHNARRTWTRRKKLLLTLTIVLAAYAAFIGVHMYVLQPPLIVSRETTFITEPLRPDGTPDYTAALHEEWSQGVTPENNAAVPLAQAFGPAIISPKIRERYFRLIGIEPPPANGEYLITLDEFLRKQGTEEERRRELRDAYYPGNGREIRMSYPELEAWVQANEEPLEQIADATHCPRFYSPLLTVISPRAELITGHLATHGQCREAARLIRVRGELHLDEEDVRTASHDAVELRRLGSLVADSPTLIGNMVGIAINRQGAALIMKIIMSRRFTEAHAKALQHQLEQVEPFPDLDRTVNLGDRLIALDTFGKRILRADQKEMRYFLRFDGPVPRLNPNVVLRETNSVYDRWVAALSESVPSKRRKQLQRAAEDLRSRVKRQPTFFGTLDQVLLGEKTHLSRDLAPTLFFEMVYAIKQAQALQDINAQETRLIFLGIALGEYRAINGAFPAQFEEMPAHLLRDVSLRDLWRRPLRYKQVGEGFLLYSIGPNGRDDGGRDLGDNKGDEERFDDIRFGLAPVADPASP